MTANVSWFLYYRLEKFRLKLEREVALQKPKLEIVRNKKQELANRLAHSMDKEAELSARCDTILQDVGNEDLKLFIKDAMRMKQLEVTSHLLNSLTFRLNSLCLSRLRFKRLRIRMLI